MGPLEATDDMEVVARAAGLRYVHDSTPGIRRVKEGDAFRYLKPDGWLLDDPKQLARIVSLGIPPAWTDVWIAPQANGHIQATGRDARGRKQYRYHERWRAVRDETKYGRMIAFGEALPAIRARIKEDMATHGLPRTKVLATVVALLDMTHIRIGNEEYAQENQTYGLTTLQNQHVEVQGSIIHLDFVGKSHKEHVVDLRDRALARIIKRCQDLPGQELFSYLEDGDPHPIHSEDVNEYLHEITGEDFTAKDFRTWAGTVIAACALADAGLADNETQAKKHVVAAIKAAANHLGNTPAVCRKSYIHPAVIAAYLDGTLIRTGADDPIATPTLSALQREEAAVLDFLRGVAMDEERDRGAA